MTITEKLLQASSVEGEVVSEMDDHVFENKLSSNDEEDDEYHQLACRDSILLSKDGTFKWKSPASCGSLKSENVQKIDSDANNIYKPHLELKTITLHSCLFCQQ